MTHTTGLIRIVLGFLLAMGALGGMEQQAEGLVLQTTIALCGLALMVWAAVDINRQADRTIENL
jgi:uncharacterized membrane protein